MPVAWRFLAVSAGSPGAHPDLVADSAIAAADPGALEDGFSVLFFTLQF
jgi:hypothetical protein